MQNWLLNVTVTDKSLRLSLSNKAKAGGKELEMLALAASENRLSNFIHVSCKTLASLLSNSPKKVLPKSYIHAAISL